MGHFDQNPNSVPVLTIWAGDGISEAAVIMNFHLSDFFDYKRESDFSLADFLLIFVHLLIFFFPIFKKLRFSSFRFFLYFADFLSADF